MPQHPSMPPLIIKGLAAGDDNFANDIGTWNVTKALRDCKAGKHGKVWAIDVGEAVRANAACEVDEEKVEQLMRTPKALLTPCIGVMRDGRLWIIDGQHRLRALHRLGARNLPIWVIEQEHEPRYRVTFNGHPTLDAATEAARRGQS